MSLSQYKARVRGCQGFQKVFFDRAGGDGWNLYRSEVVIVEFVVHYSYNIRLKETTDSSIRKRNQFNFALASFCRRGEGGVEVQIKERR